MKISSLFTLAFAFFFCGPMLFAQVQQAEVIMSHGPQNGYVQDHADAKEKHVEEAWKDLLKEYKAKPKMNRKSKELEAFEVSIPMISNNQLSIYLQVNEKEDMTTTTAFFDDGTQYLSAANEEASMDAEKLLMKFAQAVERLAVEDLLDDEEKLHKKLEKDLEKLEKDNQNLHDDIEDFQNKIAQAESDIEKNLGEQDDKQMEINMQMKAIEAVKERLNNIGKN